MISAGLPGGGPGCLFAASLQPAGRNTRIAIGPAGAFGYIAARHAAGLPA